MSARVFPSIRENYHKPSISIT